MRFGAIVLGTTAVLLLVIILIPATHFVSASVDNPQPPIISNLEVSPFIAVSSTHPEPIPHANENKLGDNVTIRFVVKNPLNQSQVYTIPLQIKTETITISVELEALQSKRVSHTITPEIVGFYRVRVDDLTDVFYIWPPNPKAEAEFKVSILRIMEVEEGMDITIFVEVINTGDAEGTHQVDLKVNGEAVYSENVTLPAEASKEVPLLIEGGLTAGTYEVEVNRLVSSLTVDPHLSFWDKIPGFPYYSIIVGLIIVVLVLQSKKSIGGLGFSGQ